MEEHLSDAAGARLGDLLQEHAATPRVREREWVELVMSVAAGSQAALHALYARAHRIVFTLAMRITANGEAAGEATVDAFQDVWRRVRTFDPRERTVLAWIMMYARARALARAPQLARPVADAAPSPDLLVPAPWVQSRLAMRIAEDTGAHRLVPPVRWTEPEWQAVGTGITYKVLALDDEHDRVSMLVRLAPGAAYPSHTHAGLEELHLLDGELWIEDRKLRPGDYNRGEPGQSEERVWSETGCGCVLVTSTRDLLH